MQTVLLESSVVPRQGKQALRQGQNDWGEVIGYHLQYEVVPKVGVSGDGKKVLNTKHC